jgi:ribosomal protein S8E
MLGDIQENTAATAVLARLVAAALVRERVLEAHVTHPELATTFCLPILGVKKNPNSPMYTQLGVITKGTVLEVSYINHIKYV